MMRLGSSNMTRIQNSKFSNGKLQSIPKEQECQNETLNQCWYAPFFLFWKELYFTKLSSWKQSTKHSIIRFWNMYSSKSFEKTKGLGHSSRFCIIIMCFPMQKPRKSDYFSITNIIFGIPSVLPWSASFWVPRIPKLKASPKVISDFESLENIRYNVTTIQEGFGYMIQSHV